MNSDDFQGTRFVPGSQSDRLIELPAWFGNPLPRLPMVLRLLLETTDMRDILGSTQ